MPESDNEDLFEDVIAMDLGTGSEPSEFGRQDKELNLLLKSDQHHDVLVLFCLCVARLSQGASGSLPSLLDVKTAWKDLKFSHVYSGKPKSGIVEGYMQLFYDACFHLAARGIEEEVLRQLLHELNDAGFVADPDEEIVDKAINVCRGDEFTDRVVLFALFCLHGAQPANQMVLIRVEEEYFPVMERFVSYISDSEGPDDFCDVFISLWKQHAFVLGSTLGFAPTGNLPGISVSPRENGLESEKSELLVVTYDTILVRLSVVWAWMAWKICVLSTRMLC